MSLEIGIFKLKDLPEVDFRSLSDYIYNINYLPMYIFKYFFYHSKSNSKKIKNLNKIKRKESSTRVSDCLSICVSNVSEHSNR